ERVCPYTAITREDVRDREGNLLRRVASINTGICEGCGACVVVCRNHSIEIDGFSDEQIYGEIGALWPVAPVSELLDLRAEDA
ncbi:MAG TPA: 4Fe-4S binding protein, partial [Anaerolineae bacterium]|nr:4Fe-4S binding protein [Anaerolineae bacterium]